MNFHKYSTIILLCFQNVLYSHTRICKDEDFKKIIDEEDVELECHLNGNVRMMYKLRNTQYLGLNQSASLEKKHIPSFHEQSSVTFKDLKIIHGYPTLKVKSLSLINVYINYDGNPFLKVSDSKITHHILNIENCYFVHENHVYHRENEALFSAKGCYLNISIFNSIFKKFYDTDILDFTGARNGENNIVFANNCIINNSKLFKFITVIRSTLIFVNNKIEYNTHVNIFLFASVSNATFYNNTVSMNFNIRNFFYWMSFRYHHSIEISNNQIKFNFVKNFLLVPREKAQIKMTKNYYLKNVFDYVIYDQAAIENHYLFEKEEFYLNNFTLFQFKQVSGNVTISNSTFQFGGFYHALPSCPLIDVKLLKNIKINDSYLTACDSMIQKRIQSLCENQFAIDHVECHVNNARCEHKRNFINVTFFATGLAVLIGWILFNFLLMKTKNFCSWKKYFNKSTQTELPGNNEGSGRDTDIYDTVTFND